VLNALRFCIGDFGIFRVAMEFPNAISQYTFSRSEDLATVCLVMSEGMNFLMSFDKYNRRLLKQQMKCVPTAVSGNNTGSRNTMA